MGSATIPYKSNSGAKYYSSDGTPLSREEWLKRRNASKSSNSSSSKVESMYGTSISDLLSQYQTAYDDAKATNEARYAEILSGYNDRYNRNMAYLEGQGEQAKADVIARGETNKAADQQDLTSRGLTGSTVLANLSQGRDNETEENMNRLQESLNEQYLAADSQLSGNTLSFMERREDEYPDAGLMTNLLSQMGQYANSGSGNRVSYSGSGSGSGKSAFTKESQIGGGTLYSPTSYASTDDIIKMYQAGLLA